ncbi:MAG: cob(I)yrinic acid a,c-diamide adenosyltransferase [Armatimonadota bacterium]|nr:cob(I)yrinic acid a,c-diamide adenosyltransferase [Armatimonadota bacterium]
MPKIYTKTGDEGETGFFGGRRVSKDHARVEAYGTLDEVNSMLGLLVAHLDGDLADVVRRVQRTLFDIGAELATPEPGRVPALGPEAAVALERHIDQWEEQLHPLRTFILPGGSRPAAICHLARAITRRAERRVVTLGRAEPINPEIVRYLNRLSDCLFVMARLLNRRAGVTDVPWEGPERT